MQEDSANIPILPRQRQKGKAFSAVSESSLGCPFFPFRGRKGKKAFPCALAAILARADAASPRLRESASSHTAFPRRPAFVSAPPLTPPSLTSRPTAQGDGPRPSSPLLTRFSDVLPGAATGDGAAHAWALMPRHGARTPGLSHRASGSSAPAVLRRSSKPARATPPRGPGPGSPVTGPPAPGPPRCSSEHVVFLIHCHHLFHYSMYYGGNL